MPKYDLAPPENPGEIQRDWPWKRSKMAARWAHLGRLSQNILRFRWDSALRTSSGHSRSLHASKALQGRPQLVCICVFVASCDYIPYDILVTSGEVRDWSSPPITSDCPMKGPRVRSKLRAIEVVLLCHFVYFSSGNENMFLVQPLISLK